MDYGSKVDWMVFQHKSMVWTALETLWITVDNFEYSYLETGYTARCVVHWMSSLILPKLM